MSDFGYILKLSQQNLLVGWRQEPKQREESGVTPGFCTEEMEKMFSTRGASRTFKGKSSSTVLYVLILRCLLDSSCHSQQLLCLHPTQPLSIQHSLPPIPFLKPFPSLVLVPRCQDILCWHTFGFPPFPIPFNHFFSVSFSCVFLLIVSPAFNVAFSC